MTATYPLPSAAPAPEHRPRRFIVETVRLSLAALDITADGTLRLRDPGGVCARAVRIVREIDPLDVLASDAGVDNEEETHL